MLARMSDHVSAGSLRNLEARLSMAIDNACQAEADLDRLRAKAGLEPFGKQFWLGAEHNIALREACAEAAVEAAKAPKGAGPQRPDETQREYWYRKGWGANPHPEAKPAAAVALPFYTLRDDRDAADRYRRALLFIQGALNDDARFGSYSVRDWRRFMRGVLWWSSLAEDPICDEERVEAYIATAFEARNKRLETEAAAAPPPSAEIVAMPRRTDKDSKL
jgi:hypothetical protein